MANPIRKRGFQKTVFIELLFQKCLNERKDFRSTGGKSN